MLEGNPGKRPLPTNEPVPEACAFVPDPPDWLAPLAKQAWRAAAEQLAAANMLHRLDLTTLELFAVTYAHWREMVSAIASAGHVKTFYDDNGNEKYAQATPEATQATKYAEQLNKLCRVLGIGPAHRVGLHITNEPSTPAEDPIAAILSGKGTPAPTAKPGNRAGA